MSIAVVSPAGSRLHYCASHVVMCGKQPDSHTRRVEVMEPGSFLSPPCRQKRSVIAMLMILSAVVGCSGEHDSYDDVDTPDGRARGVELQVGSERTTAPEKHESLASIGKSLMRELQVLPPEQSASKSLGSLLRAEILRTPTAKRIISYDSPKLESMLLQFGEDPSVQFLGVTLRVLRAPDSEKVSTLVAICRTRPDETNFFSAMVEPMGSEWTQQEILDVAAVLDCGIPAPESHVAGTLLASTIPVDVLVQLLVSVDDKSLRSPEWDAAFMGAINTALGEGTLQAGFVHHNTVTKIARQLLVVPGRAKYQSMWYFNGEISSNECVRYLNECHAELDDIELFCYEHYCRDKILQAQTEGTRLSEDLDARLKKLKLKANDDAVK